VLKINEKVRRTMKIADQRLGWMLAAILSGLLVVTTSAQDVVKVAADSHKVILENDNVRVLEVHVKPGGKVPMHSHPQNVAYFLSDAKVKLTHPDGTSEVREIKKGAASWNEPTTHAAENIGTTQLDEIQIEMKKPMK
jgi:quercetin dioxygenase-like cupin family protein